MHIIDRMTFQVKSKEYHSVMTSQSISIFAQNLIRIRKQRGLSQYDLAALTGLSRRSISYYEIKGVLPPIEKLDLIAKALGVKSAQLLEESSKLDNTQVDLSGIDSRSVKKLKDILSLPPDDRNDLYRILNKMLRKNQLETQNQEKDK